MTNRIAGLRGLIRESHAPDALQLHNLALPGTTPTPPPATADLGHGISNWNMLGNGPDPHNIPCYPQGAGCCGPAMTEHARIAKAALGAGDGSGVFDPGFRPPHTPYTQELYKAFGLAQGEPGPCPDYGVDNLTWFTWLYEQNQKTPGIDVVAFAEVALDPDHIPAGWTVADVIHNAMVNFRGACVAVTLNKDAEAQFERLEPWSVAANDPADPDLGHDILLLGYGAPPTGLDPGYTYTNADSAMDWFITWGAWQGATVAWDSACITDVWVIMTREDAEAAGYDFDAAIAAIETMLNEHVSPGA
jgi:hypothetical protein